MNPLSPILSWFEEPSSLLRSFILVTIALLTYQLPVFLHKIKLTIQGILYLLFCHDKKWKKTQDPIIPFSPLMSSAEGKSKISKKTIIFVRHGESTWNETFNKGSHRTAGQFALAFVPNLIKALLYEFYLLLSGQMDSWFYDSPLSPYGIGQIEKLAKYLDEKNHQGLSHKEEELLTVLRGGSTSNSLLVSSSLRRALSTVAIAFESRLDRNKSEKIRVIPPLQEIARNPDTLTITPAYEQVTASWVDRNSTVCNFTDIFTNRTDMSLHHGNKPIKTNGLLRMTDFCEYVFSLDVKEKYVIAGGHSIWFRSFFKTFLPAAFDHVSKKRKMVNGACVAFTLLKATTPTGNAFMIDPKSIVVVYGGF